MPAHTDVDGTARQGFRRVEPGVFGSTPDRLRGNRGEAGSRRTWAPRTLAYRNKPHPFPPG